MDSKHVLVKGVVSLFAGAAIALSGAGVANAASLYDNTNYGGFMESRVSGNVSAGYNDRTSSVRNSGTERYCENVGCVGRTVSLTGDYNNLHTVYVGLGIGESWGDRISALQ